MLALCSRQDVIDRLGGAAATRQLLDPTQSGTYDTALLDGAVSDATGDVEAALGARFRAITDSNAIPAKIRRLTAELAVGYAWRRGPKNLAMPEGVKQLMADCRRELERLENSETGPGNDPPPSRLPRYIDNSDGGRRAVYDSFRRAGINGGR